jgi:lipopolysaccharide transport system ATP-binding protein
MTVAIKVENLSKAYQIGQIGTGTISRDIERWFKTRVLGKEDPFLKLSEKNDHSVKSETNVVWSLKDVDLEINKGDAVGIIGKNGAGKSTLLKLLSRVTSPTTGAIKVRGKVASLLEVGTGFHPELTGRENIYLNGAILGMRKREIDRRLDEIIDFSGIERYIDTPVKRYSSGMYVRLAFAVAAHLESDILIVDEVLAVGDAEFQRKCLGKMEEVQRQDGRTVLFVSHNISAVHALCTRAVLINEGQVAADDSVAKCVEEYFKVTSAVPSNESNGKSSVMPAISGIMVNDEVIPRVKGGEAFEISVTVNSRRVPDPTLILIIENMSGHQIIHDRVAGADIGIQKAQSNQQVRIKVPRLWLTPGVYSLYFKSLALTNRAVSERIMLEVTGDLGNTARRILNPEIEWSVTGPDHRVEIKAEAMPNRSKA